MTNFIDLTFYREQSVLNVNEYLYDSKLYNQTECVLTKLKFSKPTKIG